MKKMVLLSVVASTMIVAGAPAVDTSSEGTVSGQLRSFYIDRTYSGTLENNRNSLAAGGWIGYDSAKSNGFSFGAKVYGVKGIEIHDEAESSASYDPSLYGDGFDGYGFVGEAYINYSKDNTTLKIGRQKLNTPLAGADDARMLPNLFEAAVVTNKDVANTTLIAAHVSKMSVGTFGNVYGTAGALSIQSGYGLGYKEGTNGDFADMGVIALGNTVDTSGVTAVAAIYNGIDNLKLQAWDYYAHDILNALYVQADYKVPGTKFKVSAQLIDQNDVGTNSVTTDIDSTYWGAKVATSSGNLSGYVAYSQTGDSTGNQNGGIITPWGGIPAFTQGMVTRHMFFADTETTKIAAVYNLKESTGLNLKAVAYHTSFDVGSKNTYVANTAWKAKETGFDIKYQATKDLNLRFRGNFPTDFQPGLDWNEYRFIANYNF